MNLPTPERARLQMRMFKRFSFALSFALILSGQPSTAQAIDIPTNFSFVGSGYGHGVGMSQVGARAKALAGESATAILNYYYTGTSVETATDTQILRINIGNLLTSAKIRSDSAGAAFALYEGDVPETGTATAILNYPSKTSLNLNLSGGQILISTTRGSKTTQVAAGTVFTLRWSGTRYMEGAPAILSVTTNNVVNRYRHGQMQFKVIRDNLLGKRIGIINSVRLQDEYLWGISEVPSLWPTAALQAQAIASRTYAIAKSVRIRSACDCHLYGSISDQSFAGYAKEGDPKFGQLWKNAVDSTAGQVITYAGQPITAYFSSSSGGITETSEHAWGTATAYTQSVSDTASVDLGFNPRFATWTRQIPQSVVATAFALSDVAALQVISINPAGTVAKIQATSSTGVTAELRGETFRSRSKLPSAWFSIVG